MSETAASTSPGGTAERPALLEVNDVSLTFGGVSALEEVSFGVGEGADLLRDSILLPPSE